MKKDDKKTNNEPKKSFPFWLKVSLITLGFIIIALIIIWNILSYLIEPPEELYIKKCLDIVVKPIEVQSCNYPEKPCTITVIREPGGEEVLGYAGVFWYGDIYINSTKKYIPLKPLETDTLVLETGELENKPTKVEVLVIVENEGVGVYCPQIRNLSID